MPIFWIIFSHEFLTLSRNLTKIFANFLFFVISVAIFFLLAQNQTNQASTTFYSITIIWFSLLSSLIFSSTEFLKRDFEDGTIEQIISSIENFEIFVLAKMLANWLFCSLPIIISIPLLGFINNIAPQILYQIVIAAFLATLAINFICGFCGSLSVLGNSAPMIGIIAMPLIIPILLLGASSVDASDYSALKILCGLNIFIGSITVFATAKIVKIAAE